MDPSKPPEPAQEDSSSLETPDTDAETTASSSDSASDVIDASSTNNPAAVAAAPEKPNGIKGFVRRFNIYLLLFLLILTVGGSILTIAYFQSKKFAKTNDVKTQDLTQDTLREIAGSDATLGSSG